MTPSTSPTRPICAPTPTTDTGDHIQPASDPLIAPVLLQARRTRAAAARCGQGAAETAAALPGAAGGDARAIVKASIGWQPQGLAVLVGMYAPLRRAEIAAVRWGRFDADLEWDTVMGKADRTHTIPVHDLLQVELARARTAYLYLFPGSRGRAHVTPATINLWVDEVAQSALGRHVTTHQLRHTAIAAVHDGTGDLRAASEFARHERLETTRIYTHTTAARLVEAVNLIDHLSDAA